MAYWSSQKNETIGLIEDGNRIFTFVRTGEDDGVETDLEVHVSDGGNKYLRTPIDNRHGNDLNEVGECS